MVGVGRAMKVTGGPLGRAAGYAWGGGPRPRPGPGRTGGRTGGRAAAEWSGGGGEERSGGNVCGPVRRRSGRGPGASRVATGEGMERRPGPGCPVGGGRAVLSRRRGPAAPGLQVGLAGRWEPGAVGRLRAKERLFFFHFGGSLPGSLRGVPIVSDPRSWFRLLWRRLDCRTPDPFAF